MSKPIIHPEHFQNVEYRDSIPHKPFNVSALRGNGLDSEWVEIDNVDSVEMTFATIGGPSTRVTRHEVNREFEDRLTLIEQRLRSPYVLATWDPPNNIVEDLEEFRRHNNITFGQSYRDYMLGWFSNNDE